MFGIDPNTVLLIVTIVLCLQLPPLLFFGYQEVKRTLEAEKAGKNN
jgi:hypothetical protein